MMSTSKQRLAVPDELDSPQAKLVYLTLSVGDEATAADLQRALGLSKLTLLAVLESLATADLVERTEGGYACT
ncbi:helix-turn-helix domain-containing protein [Natrinema salaciae]|uniref:Sugar-specific transcriptional regulator TrmB n=1 Tax=Natrinema salaciae TaxID=1186196 RepID=A0A1H9M4M3_9EURY|nr:helix-turn-helix domain-containing protein [Natrinema salaciae]SER18650.1 Sugar-specific transcriptional regulator TrmB [Natrinema salaciae]